MPSRSSSRTTERPVVTVSSGRLRGVRRHGVALFAGVPFAEPPAGPLRFRPPEPPRAWNGVREAASFGPPTPQLVGAGAMGRFAGGFSRGSKEDCLCLNVWTPAEALEPGSDPLPVLVWIHGGGFFLGAGSRFLYSGRELARRGTVVVTINYRLGALGYLDLSRLSEDPHAPSNLGLRDQIAALEWVRDNIGVFGGDPERVTLFGESAGAMSAATLLTLNTGLFHRAILQSGAAANVSTGEEADEVARHFLDALGLDRPDLAALAEIPLPRILAAERRVFRFAASRLARLPWQPSLDGRLIVAPPIEAVGRGAGSEVDLLIGTNREEWRLFTAGVPHLRGMRRSGLEQRTREVLQRWGLDPQLAGTWLDVYRDASHRKRARPFDLWAALRTDEIFRIPAIRLAERRSEKAQLAANAGRTFMYRYDYPITLLPKTLGACHAAEMPLVFGSFRHPVLRGIYLGGRKTRELSETLQAAWVAFGRHGEPRAPALPRWPEYEPGTRNTLILDHPARVQQDPGSRIRRLWEAADTFPRR